ncbi:MAG: twin-arginine translocase subunit TatC [Candidatus Limnocylindrales bacterium]
MADADALRDAGLPALVTPAPVPASAPEPSSTPKPPPGEMTLVEHLVELRNRLFKMALAVALAAIIGFVLGDPIIAILKAPIPGGKPLYYTGLGDAFMIHVKIALVVGIILSMPVILYQLWAFIAPGLTERERRASLPWIPVAIAFFALGVTIAYLILPAAAGFLIGFSSDALQPLITAEAYFDFVTTLFLVFGLIMEFPIILFALSRVGIITSKRLAGARRQAILGMTVFAALITPGGDLVSPIALLATMYILFEGTIFVVRRTGK